MKSSQEVLEDLKNIMVRLLKISKRELEGLLSLNSQLKDLGIDSVESLDFLNEVESLYSFKIADEDATELRTVSDVIALVIKKQKK